jgi:hypothetical protein
MIVRRLGGLTMAEVLVVTDGRPNWLIKLACRTLWHELPFHSTAAATCLYAACRSASATR